MNTSRKIHAEIDEDPVNALLLVLLLLKHKHVVIEELLQLLVCEVDAELLETVVLEHDAALLVILNDSRMMQLATLARIRLPNLRSNTFRDVN